jgi:hypothetical protein
VLAGFSVQAFSIPAALYLSFMRSVTVKWSSWNRWSAPIPWLTLVLTSIFLRDLEALNWRVITGALLAVMGTILVVLGAVKELAAKCNLFQISLMI